MNIEEFIDELANELAVAEEQNENISFTDRYKLPLKSPFDSIIPSTLYDLYSKIANGFKLEWKFDNRSNNITGTMNILSHENLFYNRKGSLYDDNDIQKNKEICFFKPFDLITDEAECGIYLNPDDSEYRNKCIYYHDSSDLEIYNLDIDFEGYLEMALNAKIFWYWPRVLLDIRSGKEGHITSLFKNEMPKIFSDFNWDGFITKYNSLRLSKK